MRKGKRTVKIIPMPNSTIVLNVAVLFFNTSALLLFLRQRCYLTLVMRTSSIRQRSKRYLLSQTITNWHCMYYDDDW